MGSQAALVVGLESTFHGDFLSLPLAFFQKDRSVSGLYLILKASGTITNEPRKSNEECRAAGIYFNL